MQRKNHIPFKVKTIVAIRKVHIDNLYRLLAWRRTRVSLFKFYLEQNFIEAVVWGVDCDSVFTINSKERLGACALDFSNYWNGLYDWLLDGYYTGCGSLLGSQRVSDCGFDEGSQLGNDSGNKVRVSVLSYWSGFWSWHDNFGLYWLGSD